MKSDRNKKQRSNTEHRILLSFLVMLLSVACVVGGTFALFSDTVSNADNTITAGKLDIEASLFIVGGSSIGVEAAYSADDGGSVIFANGGTAEISTGTVLVNNIVPGDSLDMEIRILNNSTIDAAKYRVLVEVLTSSDSAFVFVLGTGVAFADNAVSEWLPLDNDGAVGSFKLVYPINVSNNFQGESIEFKVTALAQQA